MSDISSMRVNGEDYDLKDGTAREALTGIGTKVDGVDAKCDEILDFVSGGVDAVLDQINGEVIEGGSLAKANAALTAVNGLMNELAGQNIDEALPATFANIKRIVMAVIEQHAIGWLTHLTSDRSFPINDYAFYGEELASVDCPNVYRVGAKAFANCRQLEVLKLPEAEEIDETAIDGCTALRIVEFCPRIWRLDFNFNGSTVLEEVTGLGGVEYFGGAQGKNGAPFARCTSLKRLDFSSTLYEACSYAFYGCTELVDVGDMSGMTTVFESCFEGCGKLTSAFDLTECVAVESSAFWGCGRLPFNNGALHMPDCEYIGAMAFGGCDLLKKLYLYGCQEIEDDALWNSSVTEIHFRGRGIMNSPGYETRWGASQWVTIYFDL